MAKIFTTEQLEQANEPDKRILDTIFAEVGGGDPEEVKAVASVFLNAEDKDGIDKALNMSSAFKFKSKQFKKAEKEDFNDFERGIFDRNKQIISDLINNPDERLPFTNFENVRAFGEPPFADKATSFEDIGQQRFYILPDPRDKNFELQKNLKKLGFDPGKVDGMVGKNTRRAVKDFQSQNDLEPDGIFGEKTKQKMKEVLDAVNPFSVTDAEGSEIPEEQPDKKIFTTEELDGTNEEREEMFALIDSEINKRIENPLSDRIQEGDIVDPDSRDFLGDVIDVMSGGMTLDEAEEHKEEVLAKVRNIPGSQVALLDFVGQKLSEDIKNSLDFLKNPIGALISQENPSKVIASGEALEGMSNIFEFIFNPYIKSSRAIGGFLFPEEGGDLKSRLQQSAKDVIKEPGAGFISKRIGDDTFTGKEGGLERIAKITGVGVVGTVAEILTFNPRGIFNRIKKFPADQQLLRTKEIIAQVEKDLPKLKQAMRKARPDLPESVIQGLEPKDFIVGAQYNPFIGNYIKAVSEKVAPRFTLKSERGTLRFSSEPQPLKSNLKAVADSSKMPASVSGVQALNTLKNSGLSKEEIEFSGVDKFLEGKERVSQEELVDFIEENKVKVETVVKGGIPSAEELGIDPDEPGSAIRVTEALRERGIRQLTQETKYEQYTLPGGENYQEHLIRLPSLESEKLARRRELTGRDREAPLSLEEQSELESLQDIKRSEVSFKSNHWDEENVLVHLRTNDRTDIDGKKVLFIEEIQSDWHRQGKKEGYREVFKESDQKELEFRRSRLLDFLNRNDMLGFSTRSEALSAIVEEENFADVWETDNKEEFERLGNSFKAIFLQERMSRRGVPNAPFKKSWHELALKEAIRVAVENDYDKIAWINGQQTADRYDLSKQVDEISAKKLKGKDYEVTIYPQTESKFVKVVPENELFNFVGKDLAEKIIKDKGGDFSAEDLIIGGEWAKTFYDKILPQTATKYIKKWGGEVKEVFISQTNVDPDKGKIQIGGKNQQGFEITPTMKIEVSRVGQPLFGNRLAGGVGDKLRSEKGFAGTSTPEPLPEEFEGKPELFSNIEEGISPPKKPPSKPKTAEGGEFEDEGEAELLKSFNKEVDDLIGGIKKNITGKIKRSQSGGEEERLIPDKFFSKEGGSALDDIATENGEALRALGYEPTGDGLRRFIEDNEGLVGQERTDRQRKAISEASNRDELRKKAQQIIKQVEKRLAEPVTNVKSIIKDATESKRPEKKITTTERKQLKFKLQQLVRGAREGFTKGKSFEKARNEAKEAIKLLNQMKDTQEKISMAIEIEELAPAPFESQSSSFNEHVAYLQSLQLPPGSMVRGLLKRIRTITALRRNSKITASQANRETKKLRKQLFSKAQEEGVAIRMTPGGKIVLSVRESGVFVGDDFANYKNFKDVDVIAGGGTDITRLIQEMDGSLKISEKVKLPGQAGQLEQKVLWRTRDIHLQKIQYMNEKVAIIRKIFSGIKPNSKEDIMINDMARLINTNDIDLPFNEYFKIEEINKISTDRNLLKRAVELRKFYDDVLEEQNAVRGLLNRDLIPMRQFYTPEIFRDMTIMEMFTPIGKNVKEVIGSEVPLRDYIKPNAPANPRAKAREFGIPYEERVKSAVELAEKYIATSARDIFNTTIIQNNKAFIQQLETIGINRSAKVLADWTAESYAGITPALDRALNIPPNFVLSNPLKTLINRSGMRYFNQVRNMMVFPLNFSWNLITQTSSFTTLTLTRNGAINTLKGMLSWMNPRTRERVAKDYYSFIVKANKEGRLTRQDVDQLLGENVKVYRNPNEVIQDFSFILNDSIERMLTGMSIEAGRFNGQKRGLTGKALTEFASDEGGKTQSMYNREDKPGVLRNLSVTTSYPYQTFAFEVQNTLREWAGRTGVKPEDQIERLLWAIRFMAGVTLSASLAKKAGRKLWDWKRPPLPFAEQWLSPIIAKVSGEYYAPKRALPSPIQTTLDFAEGFDNLLEKGDSRKLRNVSIKWLPGTVGIPGGLQASRMVDTWIGYAEGGIYDRNGKKLFGIETNEDILIGMFSGVWSTKGGQEWLKKREKDPLSNQLSLDEALRKFRGLSPSERREAARKERKLKNRRDSRKAKGTKRIFTTEELSR